MAYQTGLFTAANPARPSI